MRLSVFVLAAAMAAAAAQAQVVPVDPDWRESEAPPPPAVTRTGLLPLEIPGSALSFGVDPASVSVGPDRVVRYVVVASSASGAVNAMYEGLRCGTGDFKVYARYNPQSGWSVVKDSPWRSLHELPVSRHTLQVARTGACIGHGTNRSARQIVNDLASNVDRRFVN
jgi:hypothetical protein